mgnify:CR=1 FL=1
MAKSKPIGVRFDEDLFLSLKRDDSLITYQKAFCLYEEAFRQQSSISSKKSNNLPKILIYKLVNPIDSTVFYVGRTTFKLSYRLLGHLSQVNSISPESHNQNKVSIIRDIIDKGSKPYIELIEEIEPTDESELKGLHERELYWITEYIKNGQPITNKIKMSLKESLLASKPQENIKPAPVINTRPEEPHKPQQLSTFMQRRQQIKNGNK